MEKFVEIITQDYMDLHSVVEVITFKGDSLEDIMNNANEWCKNMQSSYSGTFRFSRIYNKEDAKKHVEKVIKIEKANPKPDSEEFILNITNLYNKCYEEII